MDILMYERDQSITRFENLSDEIYYEIFDYLSTYEIFMSFSNLNRRFKQVLQSSSMLFNIELRYSANDRTLMNSYERFVFVNKHKILSIKLWLRLEDHNFFSSFMIDSSFTRLESIFIDGIQPDTLILMLANLACLPRLFYLTIDTCNAGKYSNEIYHLIFAISELKSYKLMVDEDDCAVTFPMAKSQRELEKFYLYYYDNHDDDDDEYPIYNGKQNEFHSSFWIERQLMFEIKVVEEESIHYSIHPYRKTWYEYTNNNINDIFVERYKPRLTVTYIRPNDAQEVLMMNTRRILTLARIYHLEINEIEITISNLLLLLDLLTELDTLKLCSLLSYKVKNLNTEEYIIFLPVK